MERGKGKAAIRLTSQDNVATAVEEISPGDEIHILGVANQDEVFAQDPIHFGHKVALEEIRCGEVVRKYGESIGIATDHIHRGEHVHTHNLSSARAKSRI
jgi:altronate dehydratase small subunit